MNNLPYEILEMIATHVSKQDQFIGLTICKSWHLPFCRSLYRHVNLFSRFQLKTFLRSPNLAYHGQWIRTIQIGLPSSLFNTEDCVTGAIPFLRIQVGVTLHELLELIPHLPLLQSFNFDHRLWHFMNTANINFPSTISSLPPLDHPRQLRLLDGQMIQKLHLRGEYIFQLHQKELFLPSLKNLPVVTEFFLDGDGMWDTEHVMKFTMNHMNQLHAYLPKLTKLTITDAIHFIIVNTEQVKTSAQVLKKFQLSASVDCLDSWSRYFGSSYPLLTHLNIKLTSHHKQKTGLAQWINKLGNLRVLDIHPTMAKFFMDDKTLASITPQLETLNTGVWGHDIETSTNAFRWLTNSKLVANLKNLVIPIWNSNSMNLFGCTSLFRLELSCSQRNSQHYSIDTILDSCPVLNHLELNWGQVIVSNIHKRWHPLKTLRINHSVCEPNVFGYVSVRCTTLQGLFLRRCTGVTELNMLNSHFKYIVISEVLLQTKVMSHLKLIRFQKLEQDRSKQPIGQIARYYKTYQDQYTFQTCIRRLKSEQQQEQLIAILCGSVEQLIFNGCRI